MIRIGQNWDLNSAIITELELLLCSAACLLINIIIIINFSFTYSIKQKPSLADISMHLQRKTWQWLKFNWGWRKIPSKSLSKMLTFSVTYSGKNKTKTGTWTSKQRANTAQGQHRQCPSEDQGSAFPQEDPQ